MTAVAFLTVECTDNGKCSPDKACINHKCQDPCSKQICGANAVCKVVLQAGVCRCLPNYEGDPLLGCRQVDFCREQPCQPPATCVSRSTGYECHCPPLMAAKDGVCVPTGECPSGDKDCLPNTQCIQDSNGVGRCVGETGIL